MLSVPPTWGRLTPAWMTAALSPRLGGAVVDAVEVGPVDGGTNSGARVALSYAHGTGPRTVYVKRTDRLGHRLALSVLGALGTEARLADAGVVLPLEHPRLLAGAVDRSRLSAVVVMEDVMEVGGRPNEASRSLTPAQVQTGLVGLARLHAAFWDRPLPAALRFLRPWRLGSVWAMASTASLARGLHRLSDLAPDVVPPRGVTARRLGAQFRRSALLAAAGPQTVLHGDPHPGNTYLVSGERIGFLDWQLARTGHWSHDVGYFLVGSLEPADRRRHERQLLGAYLDALGGAGTAVPGWDEAWARYRATPAFGLATWVHTLSFGSFQPAGACVATISRFAAAYADLGTERSAIAVR